MTNSPSPFPIDIVVTYVDASAPGFVDGYRTVIGCDPPPCHVRSLGELRYALRSIEVFAPWHRNLLLVVQDPGHVPAWVDTSVVRVVCHEEFMPAERLPTFNPNAIFAQIHRIEGLANQFVLWLDDELALLPTTWSDFFLDDGTPGVPLKAGRPFSRPEDPLDRFGARVANSLEALEKVLAKSEPGTRAPGYLLFPHVPVPSTRDLWASFLDAFMDMPAFQETVYSQSRDGTEATATRMVLLELWFPWLMARAKNVTRERPPGWVRARLRRWGEERGLIQRYQGQFTVRHDPVWTAQEMDRLRRHRPRFACINDEGYYRYEDPEGEVWEKQMAFEPTSQRIVLDTLEEFFPTPSSFESDGMDAHAPPRARRTLSEAKPSQGPTNPQQ